MEGRVASSLKKDQLYIMEKAANIILSSLNNLVDMMQNPEEIKRLIGREFKIEHFLRIMKYSQMFFQGAIHY